MIAFIMELQRIYKNKEKEYKYGQKQEIYQKGMGYSIYLDNGKMINQRDIVK